MEFIVSGLTQDLNLNEFDFVDFGCSTGHSLAWANKHLGGKRGLGIDADPAKVATARTNGRDAIMARVQEVDLPKGAFSFVSMIHFLEHLPDYKTAHTAMATAAHTYVATARALGVGKGEALRYVETAFG